VRAVVEPEVASPPNMISISILLRTSWKEGKGLAHFRYVFRWSYLFKPHIMFRTSVRSPPALRGREGRRLCSSSHAVVVDFEIALDEVLKPVVEVEGTCLAIVEELLLDGKSDLSSSAATLTDDILKVDGDGVE
jgi:hypothetical protein